jgi:hypothetical protein
MSSKLTALIVGAATALIAAQPAGAAPPEPLVVTSMSDPDPNYVPPPPEPKVRWTHRRVSDNPTLDEAFEDLGRAAGQAAEIMERRAREAIANTHATVARAEAEAARLEQLARNAEEQARR